MISFLFITTVILTGNVCLGEPPQTSCQFHKPFKLRNNSCANFHDVCVKTSESDCKDILSACKDCPPSNYSFLMFMDIQMMKEELNATKIELGTVKEKMSTLSKINCQLRLLLWIIIIIFLFLVILLLVVILKIFTLFCFKLKSKRYKDKLDVYCEQEGFEEGYEEVGIPLKTIELSGTRQILEPTSFPIDELLEKFKLIIDERLQKNNKEIMDNLEKTIENKTKLRTEPILVKLDQISKNSMPGNSMPVLCNSPIKFQFPGIEKPVELFVESEHNIVVIKRKICAEVPNTNPYDYKKMKLEYNKNVLDDNQYLLANINSTNATVKCNIDNTIDPNDIIVLRLEGNTKVAELLQVTKYQKIMDLKKIICNINNCKDALSIFRGNGKFIELKDGETVKQNKLKDDDCLQVITSVSNEVTLNSVFDARESCTIEYSAVDQVSAIKTKIAKQMDTETTNMILVFNQKILEDGVFIFQTGIVGNKSVMDYWNYRKLDRVKLIGTAISTTTFSELFQAKVQQTGEEILLKGYSLALLPRLNVLSVKLSERQTFKSHERFVKLYGAYKDQYYLYVAMEKMGQKSMGDLIKNSFPVKESEIAKWSKQILEGLQYLHDMNFFYCDLRPSNILLDDNRDIKLSSFGLSIYLNGYGPISINNIFDESKVGELRYLSPESVEKRKYDSKSDVWSFGAVLVFIVTGQPPYPDCNEKEAAEKISKSGKIDYLTGQNGISADLKYFIERCLKCNPEERVTVKELLDMAFMRC